MAVGQGRIGVQVAGATPAELLNDIVYAESLGVPAVWAISDPVDALTLFAAAAVRTRRVLMGTAITRTWPRHPVSTAQQAAVVAGLAPGRFRLGVGPTGAAAVEGIYGIPYRRPLAHLRAYVRICKALLQEGAADIEEAGLTAHARLAGGPVEVPVLASALRRASFELCGAVADGAITWVCPAAYARNVALPALRAGAEQAGRPPPPLVLHVPVCISDDAAAARAAIRERFAFYVRVPAYQAMFAAAGFPEVATAGWTDAMVDAVAVYGEEDTVEQRLRDLVALGAGELMVTPVGAGDEPEVSVQRCLRLVGEMAQTPTVNG
jgi:alkanesulfonate monooxygenase SsuD/methylene tetrahydromethanopterin reductase-like flavin-dependent oxidoreductase (luciferase family)